MGDQQEIIAGIIVIVVGALLVGVGKLIVGFFRGLQTGQTQIIGQCQGMALTLKGFEGRFAKTEQWCEMHQEADDKAFGVISDQHHELKSILNDHYENHP